MWVGGEGSDVCVGGGREVMCVCVYACVGGGGGGEGSDVCVGGGGK